MRRLPIRNQIDKPRATLGLASRDSRSAREPNVLLIRLSDRLILPARIPGVINTNTWDRFALGAGFKIRRLPNQLPGGG